MKDKPIPISIFKIPLSVNKLMALDLIDQKVLNKINGGIDGTIGLSNYIKMAPKNLLNRIKKYQRMGLIITGKTKQKPKGWKRHFKLSKKGRDYLRLIKQFQRDVSKIK